MAAGLIEPFPPASHCRRVEDGREHEHKDLGLKGAAQHSEEETKDRESHEAGDPTPAGQANPGGDSVCPHGLKQACPQDR